jgi:hypothetical protein
MKLVAFGMLLALCSTAAADATVTLRGGARWQDSGWPSGTPMLSIGDKRITATTDTTVSVPASNQLALATMTVGGKRSLEFFTELHDGHHYTIQPDPCCFLTVSDADDGLEDSARCGGDRCPNGTVEVDKFVLQKKECPLTCAPPAMLRVHGARVTIEWDGADGVVWADTYQPAPVGREHPQAVVVRATGGKTVWQGRLVLHHGVRYTLEIPASGLPHVVIDTGK